MSSESAPLTIWLISLPNHSTTLTSLSYATLLGSGFHLAPMLPHEEEHYLCPLSSTLRYHLATCTHHSGGVLSCSFPSPFSCHPPCITVSTIVCFICTHHSGGVLHHVLFLLQPFFLSVLSWSPFFVCVLSRSVEDDIPYMHVIEHVYIYTQLSDR